jgi:sortase A
MTTLNCNPLQSQCGQARPFRRRPFLRLLERLFWLVGGLAAGWFVLASLGIISFQVTQAKRLEKLEEGYVPSKSPQPPLQPGEPFGKISIPRIGLTAMIAEGDDEGTLRHAVGHIPGTAAPWNAGNVALAGHRDTFFRTLSRVRLDDLILLETPRGNYRYQVARITIVDPQHVELLRSRESDLTLVTCFPFRYIGPAPQRYIVQAYRLASR